MALIVVIPLFCGVLFAWSRWHNAEKECLLEQAHWREFYKHGRMDEELEALAHEIVIN